MHVHATVAGVEMHARARATGKATPAAIYSYSRNALPVLVRDGSTADLLALNLRCDDGGYLIGKPELKQSSRGFVGKKSERIRMYSCGAVRDILI